MRDNVAVIRERLADPVELARRLDLLRGARVVRDSVRVTCVAHSPDRRPSLSITRGPDGTARCKCHACQWSGDALSLVALCRGLDPRLDFGAVLRAAADVAGVSLNDDARVRTRPRPRRRTFDERIKAEIEAAAHAWMTGRPVRFSARVERAIGARFWLFERGRRC